MDFNFETQSYPLKLIFYCCPVWRNHHSTFRHESVNEESRSSYLYSSLDHVLFRHKTGFSCFYGKLHKRKSHDVWHHCHVYRHLHNVTQSLPFGKILRIMETESKQSCVLVYRYTKGITIVLSFRREPLFSCSILLGFLYRFFCTAPADRGDTFRRDRMWMYSPLPFSSKMTFLYRIHVFNDNFLLLSAIRQSSFHLCRSHCRSHSFCGFSYVTHHASEKRYEVGRFNFLRQTLSLVSLALRNSLEPAVST